MRPRSVEEFVGQDHFFGPGKLLSRSQIFTFEPLTRENIKTVIRHALADAERGLGQIPVTIHEDGLEFLAESSDGDARRALTALEVGVLSATQRPVDFTLQVAE